MSHTRREFGKVALAGLPALALFDRTLAASALVQARPDSLINGVQIGAITYSYRSMPDQSAEATLRYLIDSNISACELMNGPAEQFAGAPSQGRPGGRGRGQATPEEEAARRAAQRAAREALKDVGHYVGATSESPIPFFLKFHDRIASFHLKDKTRGDNPAGGNQNVPWGQGDTPVVELLRLVRDRTWTMPATIELEYRVPEGSDAVKEVATCVAYCRSALA